MSSPDPRYIIKSGRFGAYFYDTQEQKELDLYQVQKLLNSEKVAKIAKLLEDDRSRNAASDCAELNTLIALMLAIQKVIDDE